MEDFDYKKDVRIDRSNGRSRDGVKFYIRPAKQCFNRSRAIIIYNNDTIEARVKKLIVKGYWPLKYYQINGVVIGSNSENNALQEYWRVCDPSKKRRIY